MMPADSPTLEVEALPDPTPPPWPSTADEDRPTAGQDAPEPAADVAPAPDELVDMLVGAVQVPFALAALARGQHWNLTDAEALTVARPLSRALPPAWLSSRILAASPWLIVATATYQLVAVRAAIDAALAPPQEVPAVDTRTDRPAPSGAAAGVEPGGAGAAGPATGFVPNPGEFAGAGLGLDGGGPAGGSA